MPIENKMNKWLILILVICCGLMGCIKSNSDAEKAKQQAQLDDKLITEYIAANDLTGKAKKIDTSGVWYIINNPGTGTDLFTNSTQVTIGDTARLLTTGKIFQQTNDFHPSFVLSQMILGWRLGIPKINKGGSIRLLMSSRYAYGPFKQDSLGLPANALLDFKIQLYDVNN